jgi:enediyne biosynthesis thioesterase
MNRYYEYRHVVEFEETDLSGNVYDINFVRWQGRCNEMFLLEYAPSVLDELREDLELVTIAVGCECLAEIRALDELSIRMRAADLTQSRIALAFDYVRVPGGGQGPADSGNPAGRERRVATGRQLIACVRDGRETVVPDQLRRALAGYPTYRPELAGSARLGTGGRA